MASQPGFETLIKKVEQNLKRAEKNSQNLSRKFTATSTQLREAEKKKADLATYVRKTELKVAALAAEHAATKRQLNKLYAGLVSVVLHKSARGGGAVGTGAGEQSVAERAVSAAVTRQLRRQNALTATTDISAYAQHVYDVCCAIRNNARGWNDERVAVPRPLADVPLCIYALNEKCNNAKCPYLHLCVGRTEHTALGDFRHTEYAKFCKALPKQESKMVSGRMDYMRRTLRAVPASEAAAARYYTVIAAAEDTAVITAEEDWRSEFVRLFSPYFDTLITPRRRRHGTANRFFELYQVIAQTSIKSQALLMSYLDTDSFGASDTRICRQSCAEPRTSGATDGIIVDPLNDAVRDSVDVDQTTLLQACLQFVSSKIQDSCCDCKDMGLTACKYKNSDCVEPFDLVDCSAALAHFNGRGLVAQTDETLWMLYLCLLWRLSPGQRPPIALHAHLIALILPHSKSIAAMLSELWTVSIRAKYNHDEDLDTVEGWSQTVLLRYFEMLGHADVKEPPSGSEAADTLLDRPAVGSALATLAVLAQLDELAKNNISADLVIALLGELLDIPGSLGVKCSPELIKQFPIFSCASDCTRCIVVKELLNCMEAKFVVWVAYFSFLLSGTMHAQAFWLTDGKFTMVPRADWEPSLAELNTAISRDNSLPDTLLEAVRVALADTGVVCDLGDESTCKFVNGIVNNHAISFYVTEEMTAQKCDDDSDGVEEDMSVDTPSRPTPSGPRDGVWWFSLLCWQGLGGHCSTLLNCIQKLSGLASPHSLFTLSEYCPSHFSPKLSYGPPSYSDATIKIDTAESRVLLRMMKISRIVTDLLSGNSNTAKCIAALTAAILPKEVNEEIFFEKFNHNFWNFSCFISTGKTVFDVMATWIVVGYREKHFTGANLSMLRDALCAARSSNFVDSTNLLRMISAASVLTTGEASDRLEILHGLLDILVDILYLPPGQEIDVTNSLLELPVGQYNCGDGRSYQGCTLLEHVACIEFMNIMHRLYSPPSTLWSRFLYHALSAIPSSDILIEHYLYLCGLGDPGSASGDAGSSLTRAINKAFPRNGGLLEVIAACETQLSQGKIVSENVAVIDTMEALLIGESNQLYYYGPDWCGYSLVRIIGSPVLLHLGTSCFVAERYLCLHVIQQELMSRCHEGAMAVACSFYLNALTTLSSPKFRLGNIPRMCTYPLSEPFVNAGQCTDLVVKEVESFTPVPTWSDTKLKSASPVCTMDGCLSGWVPMALGIAVSLTDLNLSNCSIVNFPRHIMNLHCLTRLKISHNKLSSLPTDRFSDSFAKLVFLDLSFNNFAALPSELSKLGVLQELYLNDNTIEYIPDRLLLLKALRVFDLSNNKLKTLPPGMLALRKQIQFLKLSGNPMISGSVSTGRGQNTAATGSNQLAQNSAPVLEKRVLELVTDEPPSKYQKVINSDVAANIEFSQGSGNVDLVENVDSIENVPGGVEVIVISDDDSCSAVSCVNYSEESEVG